MLDVPTDLLVGCLHHPLQDLSENLAVLPRVSVDFVPEVDGTIALTGHERTRVPLGLTHLTGSKRVLNDQKG